MKGRARLQPAGGEGTAFKGKKKKGEGRGGAKG